MAKQILIGIKEQELSKVALSYDIFPIQRGNVQLYGCMDG